MKIGDLVKDKYFEQHGIVTSKPFVRRHRSNGGYGGGGEYVWVLFQNGSHAKYKVRYLEIINEGGRLG